MSAPPHVTTNPPSPFSSHRTETRADERAHCGSRSPPPSSMMSRVRRESPSACSRPRRDVAVSPPPARHAARSAALPPASAARSETAPSRCPPPPAPPRARPCKDTCAARREPLVCWSHRSHPTPSRLLPDPSVEVVVVSLSLCVLPSQTRVWCGPLPVVVCCVLPPGSRSRAWSRTLRLGAQVQRRRRELLVVHVVEPLRFERLRRGAQHRRAPPPLAAAALRQ